MVFGHKQASKHTHARAQCSYASVGLSQAYPENIIGGGTGGVGGGGGGGGEHWGHVPLQSFMRGVSAPTKSYSGRRMIQAFSIVRKATSPSHAASLSPHRLASELKMSECLCFQSRFGQWKRWRGKHEQKKCEPWERGWYLDPLGAPGYQAWYELFVWKCSHWSSWKFWSKKAISAHQILKTFLGGMPPDPPSCCTVTCFFSSITAPQVERTKKSKELVTEYPSLSYHPITTVSGIMAIGKL